MKPYNRERPHYKKGFKKKPRPLSFDQMLRRFKKKVERAGTLQEIKKREYYEKPAQKKQRNKSEAIRREKIRWQGDQLPRRDFW